MNRGFRSRYISRYEKLNLGFLTFVVATIGAMTFFRRICSSRPAMGNSADRAWQLSQLVEGVSTAFNPATAACLVRRPDIVCPNRLGGMMQPAKTAHGAFLARRKLAASGSSRAPCAFPNLRCCPRCWLFSCLGVYFHLRILPESTKRSAAAISRPQRSFITFYGALRNILLSAGFPAMFHMIVLEQTFVNALLQNFFLLLLLNRIDQ